MDKENELNEQGHDARGQIQYGGNDWAVNFRGPDLWQGKSQPDMTRGAAGPTKETRAPMSYDCGPGRSTLYEAYHASRG